MNTFASCSPCNINIEHISAGTKYLKNKSKTK